MESDIITTSELKYMGRPSQPFIYSRPKPTAYRAIKPLAMVWHDIKAMGKPYKTIEEVIQDIAQPLYGLGNIVKGLSILAFNPLLGVIQSLLDQKLAILSYKERLLFNIARGTTNLLQGVIQLLTTPLTWVLKLPIRALIIPPITLYTLKKARELNEQLLPKNIQVQSTIKTQNGELDTDSFIQIMQFLNTKERARISATNRQFYKAVTLTEEREFGEKFYYMTGNACVRVSSNKRYYAHRKIIPAHEIMASYNTFSDKTFIFKTEEDARNYALFSYYSLNIGIDKYIPPIFKIQIREDSNLKFKTKGLKKNQLLTSSYFNSNNQVLTYSYCNSNNIKLMAAKVINPEIKNCEYQQDEENYILTYKEIMPVL